MLSPENLVSRLAQENFPSKNDIINFVKKNIF